MSGPWEDYAPRPAPAEGPWNDYRHGAAPAAASAAQASPKRFGQQLNDFVADLPRQVGLTARYGIEGVGNVADFVSSPIRASLNAALPKKASTISDQITGAKPRDAIEGSSGQVLADLLGLPQPRTAQERIVGDASRLVAGGALPIAAGASLAKNTVGTAQGVGQLLAANRAQQLVSAGAAGLAGGYTRETGGNQEAQLATSVIAGVAAPMAAGKLGQLAQAARSAAGRHAATSAQQIDKAINQAINENGLTLGEIPGEIARGIRKDVAAAYKLGDQLSPDAVRRLADYRLTGLTPTNARLSLLPAEITRQANLAKLGANSRDPAAQVLAQTQNANNSRLIEGLNGLGANTADDQIAGAKRVMGALSDRNARAQGLIDELYDTARDTGGRSAVLDPAAFTRGADDQLKKALLQGALPADIRQLLNDTATGKMPLTVDVAEQFKTRLAEAARDARSQGQKSTARATDIVREALEDTPLQTGQEIGMESIAAFNKARRMNRAWMGVVERTPALQAVRDGIEPDKFVQQFIVGSGSKSNVMDLAQLRNSIKSSPEALEAVKGQITSHLKTRALSGAADEVGNFSQSAYNKALNAIGDRKLRLFFQPEEVAQLKAIGRVASYEQVQPVGSAVNNSNTAGAVGNLLERLGASSLLGKVPLGRALVGDPLENIILSHRAARSLDSPRGLLAPQMPMLPRRGAVMLSPAALMGSESEEARRRREAGLLLP